MPFWLAVILAFAAAMVVLGVATERITSLQPMVNQPPIALFASDDQPYLLH